MGMRLCRELQRGVKQQPPGVQRGTITRCVCVEDDNFSSNLTD